MDTGRGNNRLSQENLLCARPHSKAGENDAQDRYTINHANCSPVW